MKRLTKAIVFAAAISVTGCPATQTKPPKRQRYDHVSRVVHQKAVLHHGPFGGFRTNTWCYLVFCECPKTKEVKHLRLWRSKVVADVPSGGQMWAEAGAHDNDHDIQYATIHVHNLDEVSEVDDNEIHVHGVD